MVLTNYIVKVEVRLTLHELSSEDRRFFGRADVGVSSANEPATATEAGTALAAPMQLTLPAVDVERHSWIAIRDRRNRRVITVIELLSPTNKSGADHLAYLSKRHQILAQPTSFVEIDLRRGGDRPRPPELPPCDYYVLVSQQEHRPQVGFWPISLRDQLPVVPIPLAAPDPPVPLDLQALLHQVYDAAGYGKYIYQEAPEPPLSPQEDAWARQLIP